MRKVIAVVLFCVGLLCLAQAQVPMTGAGNGAPSFACVLPSLDGQNDANGTGSANISFTTTGTGTLFVFIAANGGSTDPTVSGGSGGAWTKRASITVISTIWEYASVGATAGVQSISITNNNGAAFVEANGFGLKHAGAFDGSAVTGATSVNVVTNFANDTAVSGERTGGSTTFPNAGWTTVGTASFVPTQYQQVVSPNTVTATDIANSGGMIGDAVKCGP